MIVGIYATLGAFLILAANDPLANRSLIWFTIWSSIVHAGIILVQALMDETDRANLFGDIPALFGRRHSLVFAAEPRRAPVTGSDQLDAVCVLREILETRIPNAMRGDKNLFTIHLVS